jgi:hypothetical protein
MGPGPRHVSGGDHPRLITWLHHPAPHRTSPHPPEGPGPLVPVPGSSPADDEGPPDAPAPERTFDSSTLSGREGRQVSTSQECLDGRYLSITGGTATRAAGLRRHHSGAPAPRASSRGRPRGVAADLAAPPALVKNTYTRRRHERASFAALHGTRPHQTAHQPRQGSRSSAASVPVPGIPDPRVEGRGWRNDDGPGPTSTLGGGASGPGPSSSGDRRSVAVRPTAAPWHDLRTDPPGRADR